MAQSNATNTTQMAAVHTGSILARHKVTQSAVAHAKVSEQRTPMHSMPIKGLSLSTPLSPSLSPYLFSLPPPQSFFALPSSLIFRGRMTRCPPGRSCPTHSCTRSEGLRESHVFKAQQYLRETTLYDRAHDVPPAQALSSTESLEKGSQWTRAVSNHLVPAFSRLRWRRRMQR